MAKCTAITHESARTKDVEAYIKSVQQMILSKTDYTWFCKFHIVNHEYLPD